MRPEDHINLNYPNQKLLLQPPKQMCFPPYSYFSDKAVSSTPIVRNGCVKQSDQGDKSISMEQEPGGCRLVGKTDQKICLEMAFPSKHLVLPEMCVYFT